MVVSWNRRPSCWAEVQKAMSLQLLVGLTWQPKYSISPLTNDFKNWIL
jgi:hypothetical protein